jgi:hypothetical protein
MNERKHSQFRREQLLLFRESARRQIEMDGGSCAGIKCRDCRGSMRYGREGGCGNDAEWDVESCRRFLEESAWVEEAEVAEAKEEPRFTAEEIRRYLKGKLLEFDMIENGMLNAAISLLEDEEDGIAATVGRDNGGD